ncbi:MAG: hypothetical protein KDA66_12500, partial [Planctomycetaceae bacterium]|nr:hypothetical protein [Planctomycetaceae bacterium]
MSRMAVEGFAGANRVFISCVSDEFEKPSAPYPGFRSALRDYLAQADCEVKVQEQFRQEGSLDTVEKLAGYIKTCQAVIHLLGEKSGSIADPQAVADFLENEKDFLAKYPELRTEFGDCSDLTYTQWEAFLALHYGVDLFVYVTKEGKDAQKTHLDRLKLARKYADEIKSDTDLLGKLIGDLRKIIPSIPELVQEIDTSRLLRQGHTAEYFLGREDELAFLDSVWQRRINVVSLIAWGGVGKTSLLCEWLQRRFIDQDWKDESGEPSVWRFFDWSFYDQGTGGLEEREVRTGSVGDFFEQALTFFGDPQPNLPNKGKRLAEYIRRQHSLLLLDGLEPLQYPPGSIQAGQLLDGDLADLLLALAQRNPGLCLLTSRQAVKELDGLHGRASEQKDLEELAKPVAVELLRKLQVTGSDEDLEHACDQFGCHALSLTLLGRFLFDVHGGDVRRVDRIRDLERADQLTREDRHRTVWKVLQAYEEWLASATSADQPKTLAVLRLMGLFDRRATPDCLSALRAEPAIPGLTEALVEMADDEWAILLQKLARARLLKLDIPEHQPEQISIDAHPLIREYFAQQLKK